MTGGGRLEKEKKEKKKKKKKREKEKKKKKRKKKKKIKKKKTLGATRQPKGGGDKCETMTRHQSSEKGEDPGRTPPRSV